MRNVRGKIVNSKYERCQEIKMVVDRRIINAVRNEIFEYDNYTISFFYLVGHGVKRGLKFLFAGLR